MIATRSRQGRSAQSWNASLAAATASRTSSRVPEANSPISVPSIGEWAFVPRAFARLAVHEERMLLPEPGTGHLDALVVGLVQVLVVGRHRRVGDTEPFLCHGVPPVRGKPGRDLVDLVSIVAAGAGSSQVGGCGELPDRYRDSARGRAYHRPPLRLVTFDRRGTGDWERSGKGTSWICRACSATPRSRRRWSGSSGATGAVLDAARAALERDEADAFVVERPRLLAALLPTALRSTDAVDGGRPAFGPDEEIPWPVGAGWLSSIRRSRRFFGARWTTRSRQRRHPRSSSATRSWVTGSHGVRTAIRCRLRAASRSRSDRAS